MTEPQQHIEKLKNKKIKDAFKVYVYNKIGSMPSDVTINSWVKGTSEPRTLYMEFITKFMSQNKP